MKLSHDKQIVSHLISSFKFPFHILNVLNFFEYSFHILPLTALWPLLNHGVLRKERETQWVKTEDQLNENSIVVKGLDPGQVKPSSVITKIPSTTIAITIFLVTSHNDHHHYHNRENLHLQVYSFRVVAVDGEYQTPSRIQSVNTYLNIAAGHQPRQSTLASSGWFIGMLLAIIFLLGVSSVIISYKHQHQYKIMVIIITVACEDFQNTKKCHVQSSPWNCLISKIHK